MATMKANEIKESAKRTVLGMLESVLENNSAERYGSEFNQAIPVTIDGQEIWVKVDITCVDCLSHNGSVKVHFAESFYIIKCGYTARSDNIHCKFFGKLLIKFAVCATHCPVTGNVGADYGFYAKALHFL